jgi:antitoxin (DNA-binding transcriptional repressor) of toxin-antitoxin stability system
MKNTRQKKQKIMYPKTVGLRALRENMDKYVERLSKGESFLVLRKSTPVFKMEPVDEWGDEGHWENLDLRDKNGKGMSVDEFSAMIKKSIENGQKSKVSKQTKAKRKI